MSNGGLKSRVSLSEVSKEFKLSPFKKKLAVDNVSFDVEAGNVVALIGPNGSGKSTTLKMILGLLKPTAGTISICGVSSLERSARGFVGYLPENPKFQKFLTANDIMFYYGKLLGISPSQLKSRVPHLLELVRLRHAEDERTQGYSKGMIQRLAVAQALLASPPVLIFDEPMSGLDPLGRMVIREIIRQVHDEFPDSSIFFSTHVLSDAEQLCHSVILLRKGKIEKQCDMEELLKTEEEKFEIVVQGLDSNEVTGATAQVREIPMGKVLTVSGADALIEQINQLKKAGATITGLSSQRRSLEEALFGEKVDVHIRQEQGGSHGPDVSH